MAVEYDISFVSEMCREQMKRLTSMSYKKDKRLSCSQYDNAYILPSLPQKKRVGGVFDSDRHFVSSSAMDNCSNPSAFKVDCDEIERKDEVVIFIGTFCSIWGHALTDSLKKLWFLFTDEGQSLLEAGARIAYLYLEKPDSYTHKVLQLVGVDMNKVVDTSRAYQYKRVYVPDSSIMHSPSDEDWRFFTDEYKMVIKRLADNIDTLCEEKNEYYEKVYFSRRYSSQVGREWGERDIERVFRNLGYEIIYPEKLSILQQAAILRRCTCFATTEGSISQSAVFCKPGTHVTIVRKCNRPNFHQFIINEAVGLSVTYIDANKSFVANETRPLHGPFYLCINSEMRRFYGKRICAFPYCLRPSWWWYSLNKIEWFRRNIGNRRIVYKAMCGLKRLRR